MKPGWKAQVVLVVQSPVTRWTAARQASLSLTISQSLPKFTFIALVMWWSHPSSDALFSSCPQSFPALGTFPMSRLFTSDDQNTGASASVLPVSIQGWSPLRWTGLISLLSKGLSTVFCSTTVWKHQSTGTLPSLWSSSHNHTWPLRRP